MTQSQTTIGKAFEINKNHGIYGTFAEIGAGQETVNFFYKAGGASQTVAKSMSAYDMTVSDEIYGKQNRYVCRERLITMLNHEYRLLEKRLKRKIGKTTRFFAFAVTAATSTKKKDSRFSNSQHAWMGLRFQAQPRQDFNDIVFHVNCLDKNRLQQHEALGVLGVNLIYAGFYFKSRPKKLLSSLIESLSGSRIEIHGMSCSGPAFKGLSPISINLEILSQNLSSFAFFPDKKTCAFLSDSVFNKSLVILYGDKLLARHFKSKKKGCLKTLSLNEKKTALIFFAPKKRFLASPRGLSPFQGLERGGFSILTAPDLPLDKLKALIAPYSAKPLVFIASEEYFAKKMFSPSFYKPRSLLKSLGALFDKKTKVAVLSANKNFSVAREKPAPDQEHILRDYLIAKKQIIDI